MPDIGIPSFALPPTMTTSPCLFRRLTATALLGACSLAAHAAPTVLDFDSQAARLSLGNIDNGSFRTSSSGGMGFVSGGSSFCLPACADNGSHYLLGMFGTSINVASTDGSLFSLLSFDGAEGHMLLTALSASAIDVVGTLGSGGSVTARFALDGLNDGDGAGVDFQRFTLPGTFSGLSAISFRGVGGVFQMFSLDNITLNADAAVPVPEPTTLALALLALAGLGASAKRRR